MSSDRRESRNSVILNRMILLLKTITCSYTIMPLLMMNTMEKYYPEADKFIRERWLKEYSQHSKRAHPFATMS
jgi:hypothetical protein